jgi:DNA/RNA-binding domain of Phe-tRNA-synthetase-like protein
MWKINKNLEIKVAVAEIENLSIPDNEIAFNGLKKSAEKYHREYSNTSIGSVPGVLEVRQFFRKIGIDPTKHRPSSEALLNRAIKQKGFNHINPVVDVCNWCSLEFLLPMCAYDSDKINGDVIVRIGNEEDSYLGHNKRVVNLNKRYLLSDEISAFGSPITDSIRTAVDKNSKNISIVIFAPADYQNEFLEDRLNSFIQRITVICGGVCLKREILHS